MNEYESRLDKAKINKQNVIDSGESLEPQDVYAALPKDQRVSIKQIVSNNNNWLDEVTEYLLNALEKQGRDDNDYDDYNYYKRGDKASEKIRQHLKELYDNSKDAQHTDTLKYAQMWINWINRSNYYRNHPAYNEFTYEDLTEMYNAKEIVRFMELMMKRLDISLREHGGRFESSYDSFLKQVQEAWRKGGNSDALSVINRWIDYCNNQVNNMKERLYRLNHDLKGNEVLWESANNYNIRTNSDSYVLTILDYSDGKTYVFHNVPADIAEADVENGIELWLEDENNPVGGFNLDEISYMLTPENEYSEEEFDFEDTDDSHMSVDGRPIDDDTDDDIIEL